MPAGRGLADPELLCDQHLCGGNAAAVDFRKPSANQAGNSDFSPVERALNS